VVKTYGTLELWEEKISMAGEYSHRWKDYSELNGKNGKFRCLLVKAKHGYVA